MGIGNPFVLFGCNSTKYFCDRVGETRELVEAVENGRNVTLLAPLR